ncbi:MAG: hypothetical protein COV36_00255 [Alphaproteobacteria bacterium CG11_big_fil_rev_8_21_14_0_20_44_7]|nr:MAG: hypothetical protein COV36_00255 [Alphaproteobacteria bacterium CG11_big_fil_rev_8_21_14_0_20_44_7]
MISGVTNYNHANALLGGQKSTAFQSVAKELGGDYSKASVSVAFLHANFLTGASQKSGVGLYDFTMNVLGAEPPEGEDSIFASQSTGAPSLYQKSMVSLLV